MKFNGKMYFWRNAFLVSLIAAVALAAAAVIVALRTSLPHGAIAGGAAVLYAVLLAVYFLGFRRVYAADPVRVDGTLAEKLADAVGRTAAPALLAGANGRILWCNESFCRAAGSGRVLVGDSLERIVGTRIEELHGFGGADEKKPFLLGEKLYYADVMEIAGEKEKEFYILFSDCTELLFLKESYRAERTVVAYIVVDNIEEILQFVQERFGKCAAEVEEKLKDWVLSMHGIFRSYERNKYLAIFDVAHLEKILADRFSVLDDVRSVRVRDGMSVTVSIGVANVGGTLADRERAAQEALDLALQRGGDQAIYRSDSGTDYYGGKTKAIYKRTNVRARVVAGQIASLIGRADNVLIMGHRFGDFDSFASAVGMARFAMFCGAKINIVTNTQDKNLRPLLEKMQAVEEYRDVFLDGPEAMDCIRPDTLLIVVDVCNFEHVEYPPIVRNVQTVAVIDHHRKTEDFTVKPAVTYIEPSASSASELVAEILEQSISSKSLLKEEAELLLSGILLDTQQFRRNTGTRTFGAALYLRGEGANPAETVELFKSDMEEVVKEAKFHSNVHFYRENIAISVCAEEGDSSYRIAAAKAADKLLSVKHVEASFALVLMEDKGHISARSAGHINVQLILEKLNGGGHFDVAGAQVATENIYRAVEMLKNAIDEYLDKDRADEENRPG